MEKQLAIGIITYKENTAKYLSYFWQSLLGQSYAGWQLLVWDNSGTDGANREFFSDKPVLVSGADSNLGFAGAYNRLISQAALNGYEFFCVVNPDLILGKQCLGLLVDALSDLSLSAVCPKIYRWDFKNQRKTKVIDTCGIVRRPGLRFFDLGQGRLDRGQFDDQEIIGPSGAMGIFRMRDLLSLEPQARIYDQRMFMYKEDCDLALKMSINGFKCRLVPGAHAFHDRSVKAEGVKDWQIAKNRFNKSRQEKTWSFFNQHLIFIKYWNNLNAKDKLAVLFFAAKMFLFALFFERYLLAEYKKILKAARKRG